MVEDGWRERLGGERRGGDVGDWGVKADGYSSFSA